MNQRDPNYQSYLLRLWRDHDGAAWRALVESVATGEQVRFSDVEELLDYLVARTGKDNATKPNQTSLKGESQ